MYVQEPKHHRRYRIAWSLYQDKGLTDEHRLILEQEMDGAQNHFTWDEFQTFKETLPGFVEFWKALGASMDVALKVFQERNGIDA